MTALMYRTTLVFRPRLVYDMKHEEYPREIDLVPCGHPVHFTQGDEGDHTHLAAYVIIRAPL